MCHCTRQSVTMRNVFLPENKTNIRVNEKVINKMDDLKYQMLCMMLTGFVLGKIKQRNRKKPQDFNLIWIQPNAMNDEQKKLEI